MTLVLLNHINHEKTGCEIAAGELPGYGVSKKDISIICGLIMATKIPQQPVTQLEKILADADLEYLGTKHFSSVSELLYQEQKYFKPNLSRKEWNAIQITFLENHRYHTKFCRQYKSFRKQNHLKLLKKQ